MTLLRLMIIKAFQLPAEREIQEASHPTRGRHSNMLARIFKRDSIRTRFTYGLASAITVAVLIFSLILIIHNSRLAEKQLHQQLEKITSFSRESLAIALWQYNHDYVFSYLESLFLYEDVAYVNIVINDNIIREKSLAEIEGKSFSDLGRIR